MSEIDKVFAGSIPENYDRYLVPLIFESFARDMAQRAAALLPGAVLEAGWSRAPWRRGFRRTPAMSSPT
jgi:hypothetical protein